MNRDTSITNSEYHAERDHISSSALKLFPGDIDEYFATYKLGIKRQETEAMKIGTAFHCMVLEGESFPERYAIRPEEINLRTNAGKAELKEFEGASCGKTILTSKELETVTIMSESARGHPLAKQLLARSNNEVSYFVDLDGIKQKIRVDGEIGTSAIFDLKKTRDINKFENSTIDYGYYFSREMYKSVFCHYHNVPDIEFYFIVTQSSHPYTTKVIQLEYDFRELGREHYEQAKEVYRNMLKGNDVMSVTNISMPYWAKRESYS